MKLFMLTAAIAVLCSCRAKDVDRVYPHPANQSKLDAIASQCTYEGEYTDTQEYVYYCGSQSPPCTVTIKPPPQVTNDPTPIESTCASFP